MIHRKNTAWQPPTGSDGDEYENNMSQPLPHTPVLEGLNVTIRKPANCLNCDLPETAVIEGKVQNGHVSFCTNNPDNRVIKEQIPEDQWCGPDCIHVKGEPVEVENVDGSITTYYDYYGSLPA